MTDPRDAIRSLRAADEREAPSFDAIVTRVRHRRPLVWLPVRAGLAAGLTLVAISALIYEATQPEPLTVPAEVLALSTWRPMTDGLLQSPNRSILASTPRLDASVLPAALDPDLPEPDSRLRW